jgi:hypothetical protein
MKVRLTQIDGKLPNLALMKLAHWHRSHGDETHFTKHIEPDIFEPSYDRVYGSAIFSFSIERVQKFLTAFPGAIIGGTHNLIDNKTVENIIGEIEYENYDYSILPRDNNGRQFEASIGFTQRGCRLKCGFCVVPKKEGKPRSINRIDQIWRGGDNPKHLHLLDNDFFGQAREEWQARVNEIVDGKFRVCLNQGINVRMINDESAEAIAKMGYWDDSFRTRRLYTAWDNIGDEQRFFTGVDTLERHGIPPHHLLVYMLIGYDKRETWERLFYRFKRMADRYIMAYPMVYGDRKRTLPIGALERTIVRKYPVIENPSNPQLAKRTLEQFQRYVIKRYYTVPCPFEEFQFSAWKHSINALSQSNLDLST